MGRAILLAIPGIVVLSAAIVAFFPLGLALRLGGAPIEGTPSGSVWHGRIEDAVVAGHPLGTVTIDSRALPLLGGTAVARLTADGPLGRGEADVAVTRARLTIPRGEASLSLSALGARDAYGRPLPGRANIALRNLVLAEAGCLGGEVDVITDALRAAAKPLGGQGFDLSGTGACRGGELILPMAGRGAEGAASASLRLRPHRYSSELLFRPTDPRFGEGLLAFGFHRVPEGYRFVERGTF